MVNFEKVILDLPSLLLDGGLRLLGDFDFEESKLI